MDSPYSMCSITEGTKASTPLAMASASASMAWFKKRSTRMGRSGYAHRRRTCTRRSMSSSCTICMPCPPAHKRGEPSAGSRCARDVEGFLGVDGHARFGHGNVKLFHHLAKFVPVLPPNRWFPAWCLKFFTPALLQFGRNVTVFVPRTVR